MSFIIIFGLLQKFLGFFPTCALCKGCQIENHSQEELPYYQPPAGSVECPLHLVTQASFRYKCPHTNTHTHTLRHHLLSITLICIFLTRRLNRQFDLYVRVTRAEKMRCAQHQSVESQKEVFPQEGSRPTFKKKCLF